MLRNLKKISLGLSVAALLAPMFVGVIPVHAAPTGTFIDRANIRVGSDVYHDSYPFDSDNNYKHVLNSSCNADFTIDNGDFNDQKRTTLVATIRQRSLDPNGICRNDGQDTITLDNIGVRFVTAYVIDADNLFIPAFPCPPGSLSLADTAFGGFGNNLTDCQNGTFRHLAPGSVNGGSDIYPRYINGQWDAAGGNSGVNAYYKGGPRGTLRAKHCTRAGCTSDQTVDLTFANGGDPSKGKPDEALYGTTNPDGSVGNSVLGDTSPTSTNTQIDCESGYGLSFNPVAIIDNAISWILCPLIDGAQAVVNSIGNAVIDQLIINPDVLEGSDSAVAIRSAWNDFRIIALSVLILIGLVGVFSQALGFDFIDAYTLKKVLPRMLVAIIAITLSWDLLKLALGLTNAVGIGIRSLIETPFRGLGNASIDPAAVLAGVGIAGGVFGLLGLLAFVGTAALAVLVAFIVVSIRYVAVIFLIIVAPFAIMCSILPGTQKAWKVWHETFSGAMLMLPIVTGLLAIGASLGKVVGDLQGGVFGQLMALIVTFGPYFIIPKAFSLAGGLIGTLSGMANDRGRGAFDRLKQFRRNEAAKGWQRKKEGNWFRGGTKDNLRGSLNRGMVGATQINKAGLRPGRWRDNMRSAMGGVSFDQASEALQKDPHAQAILGDDDIATAILHGDNNEQKIRETLRKRAGKRFDPAQGGNAAALDQATAEVLRFNREHGSDVAQIAAFRAISRSSTGWNNTKDASGNIVKYDASGKMLADINKVAGSNRMMSTRLLAEARENQTRAGRNDTGGAGFSDTAIQMDKLWLAQSGTGPAYSEEQATKEVTKALIRGKSALGALGEKSHNATAIAPVLVDMTSEELATARSAGSEAEAEDLAIRAIAQEQLTHAVVSQTSRDNGRIMGEQVFDAQFDLDELPESLRKRITKQYTREVEIKPGDADYNPDATGKQVKRVPPASVTRGQVYEALRGDPTWGAYTKEYGQQQAAAQAAGGQPPTPPPVDAGAPQGGQPGQP